MIIGSAHDFSNANVIAVFRQSRPYTLVIAVFQFIVMCLCFLVCFITYPRLANPLAFCAVALLGLIFGSTALLSMREAFSACQSEAWVMKVVPEGVLVQFRALNRQGRPNDEGGVVFIDSGEIKAVGGYVETRTSFPIRDDSNEDVEKFLEIRLNHSRCEDLLRAVRREQAVAARDVWLWVASPNVIRLRFRSPFRMVLPGLRRALKILGRFYPLLPRRDVRLRDWQTLTAEEGRAYANIMADRGLVYEAAGVLCEKTHVDSDTAKRQVKARLFSLAGLCPGCGYDLQATPRRCPECGRAADTITTTTQFVPLLRFEPRDRD